MCQVPVLAPPELLKSTVPLSLTGPRGVGYDALKNTRGECSIAAQLLKSGHYGKLPVTRRIASMSSGDKTGGLAETEIRKESSPASYSSFECFAVKLLL